jgi:hypothetical protein
MGCRIHDDGSSYQVHATGSRRLLSSLQHLPFMPIAVGSKAPDFTLKTKTADGLKDVKLSANFGKKQTVLLFFPLGLHRRLHAGDVRHLERPRRLRGPRGRGLWHQRRQPVRARSLGQGAQDRRHAALRPIRLVLESVLRNCDGKRVLRANIKRARQLEAH